jgi:hypothetical protein
MALVKLIDKTQATAAPASRPSLLSVKQAAAFLGVSKGWLDKSRLTGDGLRYAKIGRRVLYDPRDLEAFLSARKRAHTSEAT